MGLPRASRPDSLRERVADVPHGLSLDLIAPHSHRVWSTNNVERADSSFQYGVDYRMHEFLRRRRRTGLPARLRYAPIVYPHLRSY
jgi:hypothetical protein